MGSQSQRVPGRHGVLDHVADLVASLHVHEPSLQWMLLDDPDPVDVALVARLATMLCDVRHHVRGRRSVPHRTHPDEFARVVSGFVDEITAKA